jgi:hypothetical protein
MVARVCWDWRSASSRNRGVLRLRADAKCMGSRLVWARISLDRVSGLAILAIHRW